MIITTTSTLQGKEIEAYLDIVSGEVIMGANVVRDFLAGITDIIGGRSGSYESKLAEGREMALQEMKEKARALGANAVVGVDLDCSSKISRKMPGFLFLCEHLRALQANESESEASDVPRLV